MPRPPLTFRTLFQGAVRGAGALVGLALVVERLRAAQQGATPVLAPTPGFNPDATPPPAPGDPDAEQPSGEAPADAPHIPEGGI